MRTTSFIRAIAAVVMLTALAGAASAQMHNHGGNAAMPAPNNEPEHEMRMYAVPPAFKAQIDSLLVPYFSVQGALSRDSLDEAKKGAVRIGAVLKHIDMKLLEGDAHIRWMERAGAVRTSALAMTGAEDLPTARAAFHTLSDALVGIAHEFGTNEGHPVYILNCPMAFQGKGADWLQDKPGTANPYLGKSMFACGTVTETLGSN